MRKRSRGRRNRSFAIRPRPQASDSFMTRCATVCSGSSKYAEKIAVGSHILHADEPVSVGSEDGGPNPYQLLLAALGACSGMTLRMYAERKNWPLEDVRLRLSYAKVMPLHA